MTQREHEPEGIFLPRLGTGCLVLIGTMLIVMAVALYVGNDGLGLPGGIFYGAMGVGFLGAGLFGYRYVTVHERARLELFAEKTVLAVAARHGGCVTPALVLLETPLTAAEAEAALGRLRQQGFAHAELLHDGSVCFRFAGLLPGSDPAALDNGD